MKTEKILIRVVGGWVLYYCLFSFFAANVYAGLPLHYKELILKDLDQMNALVKGKLKESKKQNDPGGIIPLNEALQIVLGRPDTDNMIEKTLPLIRTELDERDAWQNSVTELTDEALGALKNPKAFRPVVQVTYSIFLENLIGELKPTVATDDWSKNIIEKIKAAKIVISKEAKKDRLKNVMKESISPSELASQVLQKASEPPKKISESPSTNPLKPPEEKQ